MSDAALAGRAFDSAAAIRPAHTILYLATGILAMMTVAPLVFMLSMSFKAGNEVFASNLIPSRPTFDNFLYVFTQIDFLRFLANTLFVSATVTVIALFFHSMA